MPVSYISYIQFLSSFIMIKSLFHNFNNEQQLSVSELAHPMIIFGVKGVENDNIYVPFSFCWGLKFVNCIVNCIDVRLELPELYCNCIGWYRRLVVLYCYCIAKILIAYYCIWIVLISKSPYWSTLHIPNNYNLKLNTKAF